MLLLIFTGLTQLQTYKCIRKNQHFSTFLVKIHLKTNIFVALNNQKLLVLKPTFCPISSHHTNWQIATLKFLLNLPKLLKVRTNLVVHIDSICKSQIGIELFQKGFRFSE